MAQQPWWKDVITQAFNPPVEMGEDIGTPYGTPVTALQGGTVSAMTSGGFGDRIDINAGGSTVEYYQHLDAFAPGLHVGSQITAGELLGSSGGQLTGGQHPNSPLDSTGPHIEVGETIGGRAVNPSELIAAGPQGALAGDVASSPGSGAGINPLGWLQNFIVGFANLTGTQGQVSAVASNASGNLRDATSAVSDPGGTAGLVAGDVAAGYASGTIMGAQSALSGVYKSSAGPWLKDNIIPLVVAALIILVVLGAGNKTQTQTQVIPMPVPV